jgi:hypothetical protein
MFYRCPESLVLVHAPSRSRACRAAAGVPIRSDAERSTVQRRRDAKGRASFATDVRSKITPGRSEKKGRRPKCPQCEKSAIRKVRFRCVCRRPRWRALYPRPILLPLRVPFCLASGRRWRCDVAEQGRDAPAPTLARAPSRKQRIATTPIEHEAPQHATLPQSVSCRVRGRP